MVQPALASPSISGDVPLAWVDSDLKLRRRNCLCKRKAGTPVSSPATPVSLIYS